MHILNAIATSTHLGLTAGAFRGIVDTSSQTSSSSSLDVIQYLPAAETVSSFKPEGGCALHHDRGLLTLIWSDTVEGLQVNLGCLVSLANMWQQSHVHCELPECLLQVLLTARKPVSCYYSACIEPIALHCRWSTPRLACLRMFSCQKDTS